MVAAHKIALLFIARARQLGTCTWYTTNNRRQHRMPSMFKINVGHSPRGRVSHFDRKRGCLCVSSVELLYDMMRESVGMCPTAGCFAVVGGDNSCVFVKVGERRRPAHGRPGGLSERLKGVQYKGIQEPIVRGRFRALACVLYATWRYYCRYGC